MALPGTKAQLTIVNLSFGRIQTSGGPGQSPAGHEFVVNARVDVNPRKLGPLAGEGIDCPQLQWCETIEWYEHDAKTDSWIDRGEVKRDMYAFNPASNTFATWNVARYTFAKHEQHAPAELASTQSERDSKHWIARNGFQWNVPVVDTPRMGLRGGSHGGGGESLVIGPSRRRVIHFDIGFSRSGLRLQATQILETLNGELTIQKFITQRLSKGQTTDATNLGRWRSELASSAHNWAL